ncbi:hypothetical protein DFP72DRAFT_1081037 [Ephemerocybe angulata]|uniref:Uncharacterized protein n=1 Tax=Ephemerocybe angulata TaxID=980116 RepID=A0A8H6HBT1_9AGAR|nr:hypothetical protein DFP72DRAFT_1081037 [Tulosesus angulatus]
MSDPSAPASTALSPLSILPPTVGLDAEWEATPEMMTALENDVWRLSERLHNLKDLMRDADAKADEVLDCNKKMRALREYEERLVESIKSFRGSTEVSAPPAKVPPFDAFSDTFYIIGKGRAPGIYSDKLWAERLVANLPSDMKQIVEVQDLVEAWDRWIQFLPTLSINGRIPVEWAAQMSRRDVGVEMIAVAKQDEIL